MASQGISVADANLFGTRIAAAFISALGLVIFMMILMELGFTFPSVFVTALVLAVGTIRWRYSTIFYSHITASLLLLIAFWLWQRIERSLYSSWKSLFALGLILGMGVLVEYSGAIAAVVFVFAVLLKKTDSKTRLRRVASLVLGGLGPLLFLLAYHQICFGSPFSTGFQHQIYFDYNKSAQDAFSTPILRGAAGLLFSVRYQGLIYASPIVLFGVAGLARLWKTHRSATLLLLACFACNLLFYAKYRVWWGATSDTRYLLPVIPLLLLGMPAVLEEAFSKERSTWTQPAFLLLFALLFARSFFWSFLSVASFYDRSFGTRDLLQIVLFNNLSGIQTALKAAFPSYRWAGSFAVAALPAPLLAFIFDLRRKRRVA